MDLKLEDFEGLHMPGASPMDLLLVVTNFAANRYEEEKYKRLRLTRAKTDSLGSSSSKNDRLRKEKAMEKPVTGPLDGPKKEKFDEKILLVSSSQVQRKARTMNSLKQNHGSSEHEVRTAPNPLLELPEEIHNRIQAVGGTEVGTVIKKSLTATDLKTTHCRLSIPFGKFGREFLREEEKLSLAGQNTIEVRFFEPSLQVDKMMLRQWDMKKSSGKTSSMYVLRTHWNSVVAKNNLRVDDVIQIWSFRVGTEGQLCLALAVVDRGGCAEGQKDQKWEIPMEEVAAGKRKLDEAVVEAVVGFAGKRKLQSSDVESNQS